MFDFDGANIGLVFLLSFYPSRLCALAWGVRMRMPICVIVHSDFQKNSLSCLSCRSPKKRVRMPIRVIVFSDFKKIVFLVFLVVPQKNVCGCQYIYCLPFLRTTVVFIVVSVLA